MKQVDVLIIGGGIAGMTLAMMLQRGGMSLAIADRPRPRVASRVAAGVLNPVPGRRFAPTWKADEVLDETTRCWTECGQIFGRDIFTTMPVIRFFFNSDQNFWHGRKNTGNRFVQREFTKEEQFTGLRNSDGGIIISGGLIDIPAFLSAAEQYLRTEGTIFINDSALIEECLQGNRITWAGISAKSVVWCEGWRSAINPLWSYLPFVPAKGEILTIRADDLDIPGVATREILIAPTFERGVFRVGATYKWNFADEEPTVEGREELLECLRQWIEAPFEILSHDSGVRPAMRDIKPVIGRHYEADNHFILNGLGAKATLLAPYCARKLADLLISDTACEPTVSVERFAPNHLNPAIFPR
ncbi:FAD-dependent oxidoreductase [Ignavibacteria bacterium]|nr:FAD-binding oxidoreductase [Bacteroidota bacterium]MCZ2133426.1 FAD-binding oxidoreductase [Bacteroidota bacterium]